MSQVSVVTDSVSDLPDDLIEKYGITMVPAIVRFSPQEELKDREDISIAKFMERLAQATEPVRTSQPSPGAFVEAFRKAGQDGRPVISVQPSAKFSGTYQSACIARDILAEEGYRIEVVDTRLASMGQGWAVIEAARAALAGLPLDKVAERVKTVSSKVKIVLSVDTLTYLYRNGRLGRVQALLGSLLQLKPILSVRDGELALHDAVLGAEKVMGRLVNAFRRAVGEGAHVALAVVHAAARERAEQLREELGKLFHVVETVITETGPAIAANAGPGAYGAMLYEVDG